MILVDANLLLYAYDRPSPFHTPARLWLEEALSGPYPVRLSWTTVTAFLRISTHPRIFTDPFSIEEAMEIVEKWFAEPAVDLLHPGDRFWRILRSLLVETQVTGPLVMDAQLAALAIEHGATLYTTDGDFTLFQGLRIYNPLA